MKEKGDDAVVVLMSGGNNNIGGSNSRRNSGVGVPLLRDGGAGGEAEVPKESIMAKESTLPLPQSLGLAVMYILTSMFFFLAIRYSRSRYEYDSAFLVVLIEFTKLAVSVALKYAEDGEFLPHTVLCGKNRKAMWVNALPYAVPSFLYAVYNNLTFHNLSVFDPGTYQVFMQVRILFTGILFTVLLKQALTVRKWSALVLLMIGVAAKYFSPSNIVVDSGIFLMLFQALLSSLAGVYNEYVFKKDPGLSIHQQNFFMYFFAIVFNLLIGLIMNPEYYINMSPSTVMTPIFIPIVLLGAGTGLSAAFILKFINVIVKAFASAIEVLLTAVMAALILGEALGPQDFVAAVIVMVSVSIYYTRGWGDSSAVRLSC